LPLVVLDEFQTNLVTPNTIVRDKEEEVDAARFLLCGVCGGGVCKSSGCFGFYCGFFVKFEDCGLEWASCSMVTLKRAC
jgi:hypothetical protein